MTSGGVSKRTGCCPNKNAFERSLRRFLLINLGAAEDQRFQLFEPEGRVLESPGASLRCIKKRFRQSEKGFGQQPVEYGQSAIRRFVQGVIQCSQTFNWTDTQTSFCGA